LIALRDVTYTYEGQGVPSLSHLSLHIDRGECVLLCGKSGCGKTTVTRLLNGTIPGFFDGRLEGEVLLGGKDVTGQAMYRIAEQVGSVFQNPRTQFYTTNTTSEIAFGCENRGLPPEEIRRRVEAVSREMGIGRLLDRSIFQLSGGEKQIVALASVCAMGPDVYVLDEPSSNLDSASIRKVGEALRMLKAQGKTIVVAEHRIFYLRGLVDRALYLEEGRLMRDYTMEELLAFDEGERMRTGIRGMVAAGSSGPVLPRQRLSPCLPVPPPSRLPPARPPAPAASAPSMEMRDIECRYGRTPVLDIAHLELSADEVTAMTGENGAGKSTFATALCGLLRRQKGAYSFSGTPLAARQRIRESYMVLQEVNHQLFADSVRREVTLGATGTGGRSLQDILQGLDLEGLEERHPLTLSGGQKQRVAIAAALFCGKRVMVFDEPTSGLDYTHMVQMGQLLKRLKDEGCLLLVITHDHEFVARCCDRVLRMADGGVAESFRPVV
jgi:energy-coupling factor transport system ATP-binding protein